MLMLVVAATDRGGELEIEAAAAHGAVDHRAIERLQLGQVLVDQICNLDQCLRRGFPTSVVLPLAPPLASDVLELHLAVGH